MAVGFDFGTAKALLSTGVWCSFGFASDVHVDDSSRDLIREFCRVKAVAVGQHGNRDLRVWMVSQIGSEATDAATMPDHRLAIKLCDPNAEAIVE
jgi:hypothetical protein